MVSWTWHLDVWSLRLPSNDRKILKPTEKPENRYPSFSPNPKPIWSPIDGLDPSLRVSVSPSITFYLDPNRGARSLVRTHKQKMFSQKQNIAHISKTNITIRTLTEEPHHERKTNNHSYSANVHIMPQNNSARSRSHQISMSKLRRNHNMAM